MTALSLTNRRYGPCKKFLWANKWTNGHTDKQTCQKLNTSDLSMRGYKNTGRLMRYFGSELKKMFVCPLPTQHSSLR